MPPGFRDFGVDETLGLRRLQRACGEVFARWGYLPVLTPTLEYLDVLRLGMFPETERTAFKTVEPETGEAAVLRPDITPQIARMVAAHFRDGPRPLRLSYDGRILRVAGGGEPHGREIFQAGVELFGAGGAEADFELLSVVADAAQAVGLANNGGHLFELGHMGFIRALFESAGVDLGEADDVRRLIARKSRDDLGRVLRDTYKVSGRALAGLVGVVDAFGGPEVVETALKTFSRIPAATTALRELAALLDMAQRRGLSLTLGVDLGECHGFGYYTGLTFHLYAHGASSAVAAGGRYDTLARVYGSDEPALGFAFDLTRLLDAVRVAPGEEAALAGGTLIVVEHGFEERAYTELRALHGRGERAALLPAHLLHFKGPVRRSPAAYAEKAERHRVAGRFAQVIVFSGRKQT
jgi:ATP phosphoribosyltransferase regulatory subunit